MKLEIKTILSDFDFFYLLDFNNRVWGFREVIRFELYPGIKKRDLQIQVRDSETKAFSKDECHP